jgi:hypothetical protein
VTLRDRPQLVTAELNRASAPISPSACSFELARDFRNTTSHARAPDGWCWEGKLNAARYLAIFENGGCQRRIDRKRIQARDALVRHQDDAAATRYGVRCRF